MFGFVKGARAAWGAVACSNGGPTFLSRRVEIWRHFHAGARNEFLLTNHFTFFRLLYPCLLCGEFDMFLTGYSLFPRGKISDTWKREKTDKDRVWTLCCRSLIPVPCSLFPDVSKLYGVSRVQEARENTAVSATA